MPSGVSNTQEDFWKNVDMKGPNECWLWVGKKQTGRLHLDCCKGEFGYKGRSYVSSQLAYIFTYGEIPKGKQVNHTCDVGLCCNPKHLYAGTQAQNNKDASNRGRYLNRVGSKVGHSKLKEEQVKLIKADNRIARLIAEDYGISKETIYDIRKSKTWNHV